MPQVANSTVEAPPASGSPVAHSPAAEREAASQASGAPEARTSAASQASGAPEARMSAANPASSTAFASDTPASGSPVALCPQGKLIAALIGVLGVVLAAPHSLFALGAVVALVALLAIIAQVKLTKLLFRSLVVVPIAGMISLFYPLRFVASWSFAGLGETYAEHWQGMAALILTPWLCVSVMMLLALTTPQADLLYALERLHLPRALVLVLSFLYRYVDVMRGQLRAAQRALRSRAPLLGRYRRVLLYGNLAGSMLIRSYDRGERIHAAMLARGFTGVLPRSRHERLRAADSALIALTVLFAAALILVS